MKKYWMWIVVAVLVIGVVFTYVKTVRQDQPARNETVLSKMTREQLAKARERGEEPPAAANQAPARTDVASAGPRQTATEEEVRSDVLKDTPSENKEVYISGYLKSEVKWQVVRALRDNGYTIAPKKGKTALNLELQLKKIGTSYVCMAFLCDRQGNIIAQGRGDSQYIPSKFFAETSKASSDAAVSAATAAVEDLMSDQEGTAQ